MTGASYHPVYIECLQHLQPLKCCEQYIIIVTLQSIDYMAHHVKLDIEYHQLPLLEHPLVLTPPPPACGCSHCSGKSVAEYHIYAIPLSRANLILSFSTSLVVGSVLLSRNSPCCSDLPVPWTVYASSIGVLGRI